MCRFFTQTVSDFAKDFDLEDNSEKFWISFCDIDRIFQLTASKLSKIIKNMEFSKSKDAFPGFF